MEFVNYLIYPIAGVLVILAIGGINTPHPVVKTASVCSLLLNIYAIFAFVWWPIGASILVDLFLKKAFGDPGATNR